MLKSKLKYVLLSRGIIHPHKWLMESLGFSKSKASRYIQGKYKRIIFEDYDKIFDALECKFDDLFYYEQGPDQEPLPEGHALHKLTKPEDMPDWTTLFKKFSPEEISHIKRELNEALKDKGFLDNLN